MRQKILESANILFKRFVAWYRFFVFPRLASAASYARNQLYVFPRLAPVASFPRPSIGRTFFRAWQWLPVFLRLAPVTCFVIHQS